jgi:hypothetical protein
MRNDNGVSIVLADSEVELQRLLKHLGVAVSYPLERLVEVSLSDPEAVFHIILTTQGEMDRLVQYLNVRRGVTSVAGKRNFIGFNVDWMTRMLAERDLDQAIEVATAPVRPMPKPVLVRMDDEERDDPYAELGYVRR